MGTIFMVNKFERVSSFFDKPAYLKNWFNVAIRKSIVAELIGETSDKSILDIGCGDGTISLDYCDRNHITLLDGSQKMVELAIANVAKCSCGANTQIIQADFLEYQFNCQFDIILCIGIFSHIDDPVAMIEKIKNLLMFSGKVLIQISDQDHYRYRNHKINDGPYGYSLNRISKSAFLQLIQINGFFIHAERSYAWSFPPIDRLPQYWQYRCLNWARKQKFFQFGNSEYVFEIGLAK